MTIIGILVFVAAVIAIIWFIRNLFFTIFALLVAGVLIYWLARYKYNQYLQEEKI
jgi:multisubunit Na+/H+ antiporter MnhG subunit